jgi:hypothetical protein
MTGLGMVRHSLGAMKTLLAAIVAGLIVVATASASPPPKQLIGKWTRTVTAADVHHAGATKVIAGLTWTLVVTQQGSTASHGATKMRGQIIPSNATQVNIELGQQKPNLYDWRRIGTKLVLHARVEPNADRAAVLVGTWVKRAG